MFRGISTVVITSDDLTTARDWYTALLGLAPYYVTEAYLEFRLGEDETELGILDRKYLNSVGLTGHDQPAGVVAYWHVDDISAAVDRMAAAGATVTQPPRDFGNGQGFVGATVIDPFGNVIGLMRNPHYLAMLAARSAA